jgi:hypothetical protein
MSAHDYYILDFLKIQKSFRICSVWHKRNPSHYIFKKGNNWRWRRTFNSISTLRRKCLPSMIIVIQVVDFLLSFKVPKLPRHKNP